MGRRFLAWLGGVSLGAAVGLLAANAVMESAAIERGFALHCPVSGEFAWKGECE